MNIFKIKISKQIILLILLTVTLSLLRVILFGSHSLDYILWNIFLATIPFIISAFLLVYVKTERFSKIVLIIGGILWLLLLPNAPYLVTDLIHVHSIDQVPALYDVLFLFSSAWLGMLLAMYSLFHIEQILQIKYSKKISNMIIAIFIFLISFGIYLGRFLRFNSWDIFVNHLLVLKGVWKVLSQATLNIEAYLYTLLFFFFIYLSYWAWKTTQIQNII